MTGMISNTDLGKAESHTQAQQARILIAAKACFVESGFHCASVANIAKTAGMSPGLIYRYFENKNAIIFAIIEQQLLESRNKIRALRAADDLGPAVLNYLDSSDGSSDESVGTSLFLEMSAEATRDSEIAEALGRYDNAMRVELADLLNRSASGGDKKPTTPVAPERVLALVCMIEGLMIRKAREPNLDRKALKSAIDIIINSLLN